MNAFKRSTGNQNNCMGNDFHLDIVCSHDRGYNWPSYILMSVMPAWQPRQHGIIKWSKNLLALPEQKSQLITPLLAIIWYQWNWKVHFHIMSNNRNGNTYSLCIAFSEKSIIDPHPPPYNLGSSSLLLSIELENSLCIIKASEIWSKRK